MDDPTATITRFVDSWNEKDADVRASVVAELFSDDASYCNPNNEFAGRERCIIAVNETYEAFVASGHHFSIIGDVEAHHGALAFRWQMTPQRGGAAVATGRMFTVVDADSRIRLMFQFPDPQPVVG